MTLCEPVSGPLGSNNWTARADLENDENLLIIESEEIAGIYKEQFLKYWNGTYVDTSAYSDESRLEKSPVEKEITAPENEFVASVNSSVFHYTDCKWAKRIKEDNRIWFGSRKQAIDEGYTPCQVCDP